MKYAARFLVCLLILTAGWLVAPRVYAQATQPPFVDIIQVDRSQTPTIQLSAVGGNLGGDLGTLPLQLFEGDQAQTLTADRTALAGIQLALVVDPREILVAGTSGQTHHAEVAGAALGLIENNVITRNVDLLAVYSRQPNGALQTIQDWTKEPNLIFNSIVQDKPEDASSAAPLTDLLLQALDQFQNAEPSTGLARSLLLFSTGASAFDLAKVVAKANEQHVYIHTVELAAPNQATSRASALQQLAQQTHGQAIFLASVQNLDGLWPVLSDLRFQRTVVYQSSSTTPAPLRLQLTLPSGSTVEAQLNATNPTTATLQPAPVTTATVAANPVITKSAPAAALVATNTVAATAVDEPIATTVATTAPATESGPVVDTTQSERIVIPGTSLTLPRGALQLALPVLILLLAYFVYRDLRERKARATQNTNLNRRLNRRDSQLYALNDPVGDLKPLPKNKPKTGNYDLQTDDNLPVQAAEPQRTPAYAARAHDDDDPQDDDQNDDATIVPRPAFGDDEATYRLSEQIKQPIIGSFVRVAGNPTLPNELPIYGLSPARGEIRQIHIGRHSKNNTVVINDKSISREHAVILQKEGRLYLRDNASTAGTFLNGKRLQPGEELLLRHNDLASFGEVVYEFHAQGEDEATVAGE